MEVDSAVCEIVREMVDKVVRKENRKRRRVSLCESAKKGDGIQNKRDRLVIDWAKTCMKHNWMGGFNYSELSSEEINLLKEATQDLFYRIYRSPHHCIPLLTNGAGRVPIITLSYLINYMTSEINYLHSVF